MTRIRPIDRGSIGELRLVAQRMRETLEEVLGEERGCALYSMEWLEDRVRWHLDGQARRGEILLAIDPSKRVIGHTIVRVEEEEDDDERKVEGEMFGLFSTIFVEPTARKGAVATKLVRAGEAWMLGAEVRRAKTYTDRSNAKLINLFTKLA